MRTKIFFDTEFTQLVKNTTLISIGLISETGHRFYAEFSDYDKSLVDDWIQKHVIANLWHDNFGEETADNLIYRYGERGFIAKELKKWLNEFGQVEMVSDCLAYDWVLFCDLYGGAFGVPKNVYYIPTDICTMFVCKGIDPDINREEFVGESNDSAKHNALWDAEIIMRCYNKLVN